MKNRNPIVRVIADLAGAQIALKSRRTFRVHYGRGSVPLDQEPAPGGAARKLSHWIHPLANPVVADFHATLDQLLLR